ncbi:MAG: hypothetical protein WBD90_15965, partial [Xanthobacteraceae bacterium]
MAERVDKITAAVPLGGFGGIRLKPAGLEIQSVPYRHVEADAQRERQPVRLYLLGHGLYGLQIGPDCECVLARHFGVSRVRHRRKEPNPA